MNFSKYQDTLTFCFFQFHTQVTRIKRLNDSESTNKLTGTAKSAIININPCRSMHSKRSESVERENWRERW